MKKFIGCFVFFVFLGFGVNAYSYVDDNLVYSGWDAVKDTKIDKGVTDKNSTIVPPDTP